jgi:FkbM family methyltransferase
MARKGLLNFSDLPNRIRYRFRRMLGRDYRISDGTYTYLFRCHEWIELVRARTLLSKEPGTIRWISDTVKAGDVFYDIGANIGLYTVMAGKRVGTGGAVVSFEPHLGNGMRLLENIGLNGLADRAIVLSTALHDQSGFIPFHYRYHTVGSSNSQLGEAVDEYGNRFRPESTELKFAETLDDLLAKGVLTRPPTHVKIDVDGNENRIIAGMRQLLAGDHAPTWIQIEVNPQKWPAINGALSEAGYEVTDKSFTAQGEKKIGTQGNEVSVPFNAVFRRMAGRPTG